MTICDVQLYLFREKELEGIIKQKKRIVLLKQPHFHTLITIFFIWHTCVYRRTHMDKHTLTHSFTHALHQSVWYSHVFLKAPLRFSFFNHRWGAVVWMDCIMWNSVGGRHRRARAAFISLSQQLFSRAAWWFIVHSQPFDILLELYFMLLLLRRFTQTKTCWCVCTLPQAGAQQIQLTHQFDGKMNWQYE